VATGGGSAFVIPEHDRRREHPRLYQCHLDRGQPGPVNDVNAAGTGSRGTYIGQLVGQALTAPCASFTTPADPGSFVQRVPP
jgi:hypothetical protein